MNSSLDDHEDRNSSNAENMSASDSANMKSNNHLSYAENEFLSSQSSFDAREEMKEGNDENQLNHLSNGLNQLVESSEIYDDNFTDSIDSDYLTNLEISSEDALGTNENELNSIIRYEHFISQQHGNNLDTGLNDNIHIANYERINEWCKDMIEHNENKVNYGQNENSRRFKFNHENGELVSKAKRKVSKCRQEYLEEYIVNQCCYTIKNSAKELILQDSQTNQLHSKDSDKLKAKIFNLVHRTGDSESEPLNQTISKFY